MKKKKIREEDKTTPKKNNINTRRVFGRYKRKSMSQYSLVCVNLMDSKQKK